MRKLLFLIVFLGGCAFSLREPKSDSLHTTVSETDAKCNSISGKHTLFTVLGVGLSALGGGAGVTSLVDSKTDDTEKKVIIGSAIVFSAAGSIFTVLAGLSASEYTAKCSQ